MTRDEPVLFEPSRSRVYRTSELRPKKLARNSIHICDLPLEILDLIRIFVEEDDPKNYLKLLTVCKSFYLVFRVSLYENINIIIPHGSNSDDSLSREALIEHAGCHKRTLITDLTQGLQFLDLIESRPDLESLVKNLHINCLNLNIQNDSLSDSIKQIMDIEEYDSIEGHSDTIYKSEIHKFLLLRRKVPNFLCELFKNTKNDFSSQKALIPNSNTYLQGKREFNSKDELHAALLYQNSPTFYCTDTISISNMLFQPYRGEQEEGFSSLLFWEFFKKALFCITEIPFQSSSLTALNFINRQNESSFGEDVDKSIAFMTFRHYFICPKTPKSIKGYNKQFNPSSV